MTATTPVSAAQIDAILPQTQCRQCGYQGCLPYAEAIAAGTADINRCPPGGDAGITALAALTGHAAKPLDETCGITKPLLVAKVDEANCIGCTLCIQACPVDAIVGAAKHMHTVLADRCTGCELCLPPCPTECIDLLPAADITTEFPMPLGPVRAAKARTHHQFHLFRIARDKQERAARLANAAPIPAAAASEPTSPANARQAAILAAMERARQQLEKPKS
ncbi:RnfABCDGE type electron transport complex subunit B [Leeia oryzae]|uniref:RnfABCDGE type electron transport complex subunit B n=1 Tax=Leeia oryzae TaxID=356662 RepID=UPI00037B1677|nr:RnfABCDGE type electron transport complex subunit B [Leeia oryzae]